MPSDKTVRWSAVVFSIVFAIVVSMGYIPGLNPHVHDPSAAPMAPGEHTMMGLYVISLLDDVTHVLSALLFLAGAIHSARMSRLALTAFGWYYAYDATIYIVTGILQQKPLGANLGLNGPHVILSSIMLFLAYRGRANVPKAAVA
ncbi:MAG: DUF4383 domain-containing protein [Phycisphaerae bacterium]|nr:DUF4383 domain-containing protein [Gemmatimonadaceae bacterium]